ncbi:hypothetical protein BMS3Bbin04_00369 [bacterium BMS3Bbin04]|nr:hypothetical protein BMS3Bbin04_00369 [bacterium BMS3Bbin04]
MLANDDSDHQGDLNEQHAVDLDTDRFAHGTAAGLILQRNRDLGNLLTAERAVFYVQILHSLLQFRRAHELEPLHEDLFDEVQREQADLSADSEYSSAQYAIDVRQLLEWKLIEERIELERLRGYQDTRRKKYRYRLKAETRAFLEWLEERARDDLEESGSDTRNLLESVLSSLRELNRVLYRVGTKRAENGDARRVLHQLTSLDELTHTVTSNLVSFNERMYGFLMADFAVAEARQILDDLQVFVDEFLRQIHRLRDEVMETLRRLGSEQAQAKIRHSMVEMEVERKKSAHLLRRTYNEEQVASVPRQLLEYYREEGQLDLLCRRISRTAKQIWHRLYLRLRERERRSHRLEDLRLRISEIATFESDQVPHSFLLELIAPAQLASDPNYWTAREKATPPAPRRYQGRQNEVAIEPLRCKQRSPQTARALEKEQLARLVAWLNEQVFVGSEQTVRLAAGRFAEFDDLASVLQLIKTGMLGKGKKLINVGYSLAELDGRDQLEAGRYQLELDALEVTRGEKGGNGHPG